MYDHLLIDEEDLFIILAREIHFSGSFRAMLDYYRDENNKGVHSAVSYHRIEALAHVEQALGDNIAPLFLQGADVERVMRAKKMYKDMRDALSTRTHDAEAPHLVLLECLLSEEPIDLLVKKQREVFLKNPSILHSVITSDALYDPLSPGYGWAPLFAICMIQEIGAVGSVDILFERLYDVHHEDRPEIDEQIVQTVRSFGEVAKKRMMDLAEKGSEKALSVLVEFMPDSDVAKMAVSLKRSTMSQSAVQYLSCLLTV